MNPNLFPVSETYFGYCTDLAVHIEQVLYQYLKNDKPTPTIVTGGKRLIQNPTVGVAIIHAFAQRYVDEFCAMWSGKEVPAFEEVMLPFIKVEWRCVYDEDAKENVLNYELFEQLSSLLIDLRTDLRVFMGQNHWVMHFFKANGSDFYVRKTIDYRIYDWERRMTDGSWTNTVEEVEVLSGELTANEQSLLDEKKHRAKEERERIANDALFGHI